MFEFLCHCGSRKSQAAARIAHTEASEQQTDKEDENGGRLENFPVHVRMPYVCSCNPSSLNNLGKLVQQYTSWHRLFCYSRHVLLPALPKALSSSSPKALYS
eukprot:gb/GECG01006499.1/.p1 GENE.gb/GECG01006499.1/~~gb/GECG01006499.1/.p1  ORF type:complete len:102 (+),score=8.14 gb/GECG01006499.1/:1-306(+)